MNIKKFYFDTNQQRDTTFVSQIQNAYPIARPMDLGTNSGDILVQLEDKTLLFEVKSSVNDFVASIMDRRLFQQAEGMKQVTPWCFLLHPEFKYDSNNHLFGMWGTAYAAHEHWSRKHIDGAIRAIVARGVIPQSTYQGLITALRECILWASDADAGAVTQEPIKLSPFDKDDQEMVNLLCWFDGIGVKQAKSFLDWFSKKNPTADRITTFNRLFGPFEDGDKPAGWTNNTIERNRKKMGLEPLSPVQFLELNIESDKKKKRAEWVEELSPYGSEE